MIGESVCRSSMVESGPRRLLRDMGAAASLITAAVLVPLALSLMAAW